jgi:hypothetical protein
MWQPKPAELYTVGENSSLLGRACVACRQPFALGDVITWRPWPPDTRAEQVRLHTVHRCCLPTDP